MYIIKLAWNNLWYNTKRTAALLLIIAVASSAILLYQGYVEYSSEGMTLGYISTSGNFQIATERYWQHTDDADVLMDSATVNAVRQILASLEDVTFYDCVFEYDGIIGTETSSAIFWGKGYDEPNRHSGVVDGMPVFRDDDTILIGSILASKLHHTMTDGIRYLSVMSSSPEAGLCLGSFAVSGIVETGIPQNDAGLLISTRATALSLLESDDAASYVQVHLSDNKKTASITATVEQRLHDAGIPCTTKTWEELNPSFKQVDSLNRIQFSVIRIILGVLIFIALMQTLSTAFLERLNEFGTVEAIGMPKWHIICMVLVETAFLIILGIILSFAVSAATDVLVQACKVTLNPPGYTASYPVRFYFVPQKVAASVLFILLSCALAVVMPVKSIFKTDAARLINHI